MRTLKGDDIGEVMRYAFSPRGKSLSTAYGTFTHSKERLNRTLQEDTQKITQGSYDQRNKIFAKFHTRAT